MDQELASAYQMIVNARGSNYINYEKLNPKDLGINTQDSIDKMVEEINTSVEAIKKMSEIQEANLDTPIKINNVANDYVMVNPTPSNDPKTSAEYNRGFAMGVKSSFVAGGSVVAAGYLMKGAEGLYKNIHNKMNKKDEKANTNNKVAIQQQVPQQQPVQQLITQQQPHQQVQQLIPQQQIQQQ